MSNSLQPKTFSSSYLYNTTDLYERGLYEFIIKGDRINKNDESFEDIRYDVKRRQLASFLVRILDSNKVVLVTVPKGLPKSFKIICAKDLKGDNKNKVFIDCTGLINMIDGKYKCDNTEILIAYLLSATNQYIYYIEPNRLLNNNKIVTSSTNAFALLFTHVIDYLFNISSIPGLKTQCLYLSSLYYSYNHLSKEINTLTKSLCKSIASEITLREENIIFMQINPEVDFINIKTFINCISRVLKLQRLSVEILTEKWIYLYGTGTQFSLEMYVSFAKMITDAYIGCYINNQKTIEKLCGRHMVDYTLELLKIGSASV